MKSLIAAGLVLALLAAPAAAGPRGSFSFTTAAPDGYGGVSYFSYSEQTTPIVHCTCHTHTPCRHHGAQTGTWVYDTTTGRYVFLPNMIPVQTGSPFPVHQQGDPHAAFRSTFGTPPPQTWPTVPGMGQVPSWGVPHTGNAIGLDPSVRSYPARSRSRPEETNRIWTTPQSSSWFTAP